MWNDLIVEAQAAGQVRKSINASVARMLLFGSVTWSPVWLDPNGERSINEIADLLVDIFFIGIVTDAGRSAIAKAAVTAPETRDETATPHSRRAGQDGKRAAKSRTPTQAG
jgi:hypothetical protein